MLGESQFPSDETLLGYLLGALSDEESAAIEDQLANSEALMQRLSDLRSMLEPFAEDFNAEANLSDDELPPVDLVSQTMERLWQEESSSVEVPLEKANSSEGTELQASVVVEDSSVPIGIQIAWLDSLVAIAAGVVFLSFLLPGLLHWREVARKEGCSENLRNLGDAFRAFAQFQPAHRLPAIEPNGPLSFAGVYAIRLQDFELLEQERWLQCPSEPSTKWLASVPTSLDYLLAGPQQQEVWRFLSGGDYAYNMGTFIAGRYEAPQVESPSRIAWVGDRWPVSMDPKKTLESDFQMHGSRAVNILFSDGSVQWLRFPKIGELLSVDHPYLNDRSEQAPGVTESDACLAPSHFLPAAKVSAIRTIDRSAPPETALRRPER